MADNAFVNASTEKNHKMAQRLIKDMWKKSLTLKKWANETIEKVLKPDFEASFEQVKNLQMHLKAERQKLIRQAVFRISGRVMTTDSEDVRNFAYSRIWLPVPEGFLDFCVPR